MKHFILLITTCVLTFSIGCNTDQTNQKLISKIDSLNTRLTELEENQKKSEILQDTISHPSTVQKVDTINLKSSPKIQLDNPKRENPTTEKTKNPEKKTEPQTPAEVKNTYEDTIYHYYINPKRISVKITPWKDEKRRIILFDTYGKETYSIEDVRHSYTSISEIKSFHTNGAVDRIETHLNPDASMYWY